MKKSKFSIRRSHRNGVPFHPIPEEPSMVFEECFGVASRNICGKDFPLKHHLFRSSTQIRPKLLANPRQPIEHLVSFCLRIIKNFLNNNKCTFVKIELIEKMVDNLVEKIYNLGCI